MKAATRAIRIRITRGGDAESNANNNHVSVGYFYCEIHRQLDNIHPCLRSPDRMCPSIDSVVNTFGEACYSFRTFVFAAKPVSAMDFWRDLGLYTWFKTSGVVVFHADGNMCTERLRLTRACLGTFFVDKKSAVEKGFI